VSKREASMLKSHYPETSRKIVVISNCIEEDVLRYKWSGHDSDYMIYAGRVEKYKRLDLAIETAKELGLRLMIIGKGSYRDKLMKFVGKRCKGSAIFIDPQPRETYLKMLSEARYAINPSRHEAYSIFIAEALAIGTSSITTREIAENIEAETKSFGKELSIAGKSSYKHLEQDNIEIYGKPLPATLYININCEVYDISYKERRIADEIIKIMKLKDVKKIYRPMLHGVGWPGDVKRIALKIDRLKSIGFKPRMSSREAVRAAVEEILEELEVNP
jgi:hypothetical protein